MAAPFIWFERASDKDVSREDTGNLFETGIIEPINTVSSAAFLVSGVGLYFALVNAMTRDGIRRCAYAVWIYGILGPLLAVSSAHCHATAGLYACSLDYFFATVGMSVAWVDLAFPRVAPKASARRTPLLILASIMLSAYTGFVLAAEHMGVLPLDTFSGVPSASMILSAWFIASLVMSVVFGDGIGSGPERSTAIGLGAALGLAAGIATYYASSLNGEGAKPPLWQGTAALVLDATSLAVGATLYAMVVYREIPKSGRVKAIRLFKEGGGARIVKHMTAWGIAAIVLIVASAVFKMSDDRNASQSFEVWGVPVFRSCMLGGFDHAVWHLATAVALLALGTHATLVASINVP